MDIFNEVNDREEFLGFPASFPVSERTLPVADKTDSEDEEEDKGGQNESQLSIKGGWDRRL